MTHKIVKPKVSCSCIQKKEYASELFGRPWQGRCSPLYWRIPILLWALTITIWSVSTFWGSTEGYLMYMTHWGLVLIIFESFFGVAVTMIRSSEESTDATFGLPWYVKTYWVLYNITIPVAFLISLFYWCILKSSLKKMRFAPSPVLDVMVHGVNSAVMFLELISSAHPSRILHVLQPLYFGFAYLVFTIIFYFAGGVDPSGNPFIYPVIDWSKPQETLVVVALTALFLSLLHLLVVGIAALRDVIARRCLRVNTVVYLDGFRA